MSPCPRQIVGQQKAAPEAPCTAGERGRNLQPARLPPEESHPMAPALPVSSLAQAHTKFTVRSGKQRGIVERTLAWEEESPP